MVGQIGEQHNLPSGKIFEVNGGLKDALEASPSITAKSFHSMSKKDKAIFLQKLMDHDLNLAEKKSSIQSQISAVKGVAKDMKLYDSETKPLEEELNKIQTSIDKIGSLYEELGNNGKTKKEFNTLMSGIIEKHLSSMRNKFGNLEIKMKNLEKESETAEKLRRNYIDET